MITDEEIRGELRTRCKKLSIRERHEFRFTIANPFAGGEELTNIFINMLNLSKNFKYTSAYGEVEAVTEKFKDKAHAKQNYAMELKKVFAEVYRIEQEGLI